MAEPIVIDPAPACHYSVIVVSDDNSTEVCTTPSARDSCAVPIYSVTVVHVKYLRFQSSDVIRTSENSRNFRVSGKRHLKTASLAENTNVQNSQKLRQWTGSKSIASSTTQMSAMSRAAAGSMISSESIPTPAMSAAHATAAAAKLPVCVIEPTTPSGQIGARSSAIATCVEPAPRR